MIYIYVIFIYIYIYIKKSSQPSMEPWGIPALASAQEEVSPLCFLFLKKFDNRFKRLPDIPFCFSLKIITSCPTLLKALDMLTNTLQTSKLSSNDWYILQFMDKSWLIQKSLHKGAS